MKNLPRAFSLIGRWLKDKDNRPLFLLIFVIAVGTACWYGGAYASAVHVEGGDGAVFTVASSTGASYLTITTDGKIGIGTEHPQATLEVNGPIRLTQKSAEGCGFATEGEIAYNPDNKHFWGCDGYGWHQLDN